MHFEALTTDLYELTMAASYFEHGLNGQATFSLFIRAYPPHRNFFVAAGLADLVEYLESFQFTSSDLDYLHSTKLFKDDFLDYLRTVRFTGRLMALPEGTIFFADEPILEIDGSLLEAQLLESVVINIINLQTMIATKAARVVQAAGGRRVVDFSLRRTQGIEAGLKVARSCYLAGYAGSSNVLAGKLYGVPVVGTMAHSYVAAYEREIEAYRAFVQSFPANAVLLIDTYDTVEGAHKAVKVGREMKERGQRLRGVRLDSGDLVTLSHEVRRVLDEGGFQEALIFASGGFDEYKVSEVLKAGAAIDSFGVGTKVGVSADAPYLDISYKLVMIEGRPVMKLSKGKKTLVGPKQIHRLSDSGGRFHEDILSLREEDVAGGEPLLRRIMDQGLRAAPVEALTDIRDRFQAQLKRLPRNMNDLEASVRYPVRLSEGLSSLQERVEQRIEERELGES